MGKSVKLPEAELTETKLTETKLTETELTETELTETQSLRGCHLYFIIMLGAMGGGDLFRFLPWHLETNTLILVAWF